MAGRDAKKVTSSRKGRVQGNAKQRYQALKSRRGDDFRNNLFAYNNHFAPRAESFTTAMAQVQPNEIAAPGQFLGPATKYTAGPGTHIHDSNLYSSLLGHISITQPEKSTVPTKRIHRISALTSSTPNAQSTVSVTPAAAGGEQDKREVLPEVGNIVLCRVTRITPREATMSILIVGDAVLSAQWQGIVRVQDVRATEKDKVKIYESFRPGDIVRAQVISLGDQANYYLTTAANELGVVMATSEAGNAMYPLSWKEYKDNETGLSEARKVARPFEREPLLLKMQSTPDPESSRHDDYKTHSLETRRGHGQQSSETRGAIDWASVWSSVMYRKC
ncbi:hypothetical protein F5Y18DRAFT_430068 [Xylariaceae sp. FL1019]|nr:hypothetical protein F5Y18DRAFT_430068 [Xylariaceae sp. FL1019]